MRHARLVTVTLIGCLLPSVAGAAPTPAQRCAADVELAAAKYAQCRLNSEARHSRTPNAAARTAALTRCASKLTSALDRASSRYGGASCTAATAGQYQAHLTQCSDEAAAAAAPGGTLPACGNGAVDVAGEQCDGADLGGASCTSLGFAAGTLGCTPGCGYDTGACTALPSLLATGQITCWDTAGNITPCAGTGHDGDLQRGNALAYVDNGDGTITDPNTSLMWEKLSDDGSIHDMENDYTWDDAYAVKIAALNAGGGFAGYTDWRLPNRRELESILNLQTILPAVSPAFDTGCLAGCTVLTCSCTVQYTSYWSSTSYAELPQYAWTVYFTIGLVDIGDKAFENYVRAVRGGP